MKLCTVDVMKIPSYCDNFITKQCFCILCHFLNIFCQFTHNITEFGAFSSITLPPAETLLPNTLLPMLMLLLGGCQSLIKVAYTNSGYLPKHEQLSIPIEENYSPSFSTY